MNKKEARRRNRKEKQAAGFKKIEGRGISKAVKQALAEANTKMEEV